MSQFLQITILIFTYDNFDLFTQYYYGNQMKGNEHAVDYASDSQEMHTKFSSEKLKERNQWVDAGVRQTIPYYFQFKTLTNL